MLAAFGTLNPHLALYIKKKIDRITWSLQGRMEHGQITFNPDKDWRAFKNQMLDFLMKTEDTNG